MASRGLLKCPDDYRILLNAFIEKGIEIELDKELLYNNMLAAASLGKDGLVEEYKTDVIKLIHPEYKSPEERVKSKATEMFSKDKNLKMRIKADRKTVIKTSNPLEQFTKLN